LLVYINIMIEYKFLQAETKSKILKDVNLQNRLVELRSKYNQKIDISNELSIIENEIGIKMQKKSGFDVDWTDFLKKMSEFGLIEKK